MVASFLAPVGLLSHLVVHFSFAVIFRFLCLPSAVSPNPAPFGIECSVVSIEDMTAES